MIKGSLTMARTLFGDTDYDCKYPVIKVKGDAVYHAFRPKDPSKPNKILIQKGDKWFQWSSDDPDSTYPVPEEHYYKPRPKPWTKKSSEPDPDPNLVRFRQDMETSGNSDIDDVMGASGANPWTELDSREWAIVCLTNRGYTREDIGRRFGITRERVTFFLNSAIQKLQTVAKLP